MTASFCLKAVSSSELTINPVMSKLLVSPFITLLMPHIIPFEEFIL